MFRFDKTVPMWHEVQGNETLLLIGRWPYSKIRSNSDAASIRGCIFFNKSGNVYADMFYSTLVSMNITNTLIYMHIVRIRCTFSAYTFLQILKIGEKS